MTDETMRICIDRYLDSAEREHAATRALVESPTNAPILPPEESLQPGPLEMAFETRALWQVGRVLRVHFMDGLPEVQAKVAQVASRWMDHANIKLEFGNDPSAEIRISFTADSGSWSYIGTDALGVPLSRPTMNYGWLRPNTDDIEYQRVVLHEFGHALGCIHEHQQPDAGIPWDKEAVYARYGAPPNNWTREQVDVNLLGKYSRDQTQFSEFDPQSIMLYAIPNALTLGDWEVGWNSDLSETDIQFIGTIYPFETKDVVDVAIDGDAVSASIGSHGEEDLFRFEVVETGQYAVETRGWTDVVMGLFGPDDETLKIAEDDDSGRFLNARLVATLEPGSYYVRVRHYRPTGRGKYRIAVTREP